MDDLISRAAAIAEIEEYLHGLDSCISEPDLKLDGYKNGLQVAIQELKALPAVDAAPVVHGRWMNIPDKPEWDQKMCSVCGDYFCCQANYCPNCGAKMDGERRDEDALSGR